MLLLKLFEAISLEKHRINHQNQLLMQAHLHILTYGIKKSKKGCQKWLVMLLMPGKTLQGFQALESFETRGEDTGKIVVVDIQ